MEEAAKQSKESVTTETYKLEIDQVYFIDIACIFLIILCFYTIDSYNLQTCQYENV